MINYDVLQMAASQIGTLEWKRGSNPKVEEYLAYGFSKSNKKTSLKDSVPWCSGFVAWCLEKCGRESTNSLMARSYENWGLSTKKDPLPGDIVVFYRSTKASGKGHVGFFVGFSSEGNILCLGGNQNDAVNITEYGLGRMTDIRRSSKAPKYSKTEIKKLESLADKILSGVKIEPPGSVV